MIIEMQKQAKEKEVGNVISKIKKLKLEFQLNQGKEKIVIAVLGSNTGDIETQSFEVLPGVEKVIRIMKPYKLASRNFKKKDTIVKIRDIEIGGNKIIVMAGPCSVENKKQIFSCAQAIKKAGGKIIRGGAYKPRTSPYSFQGLKEDGLKMLAEAAQENDLLVVTEVISTEYVEIVSSYADILQIGARNMQNYELLKKVSKSGKPVLLKRGPSAEIEGEWLTAADYLLDENDDLSNVILCERGIKTFEKSTRYTLDISSIGVVKENSHLPIIVDPSHAAGHFRYVSRLAKAAIAAGADGIIIEIHPCPWDALSDGAQSLTFSDFYRLMDELKKIAQAVGREI